MDGTQTSGSGAYVHVPFCSRRCDYCAFATWTDREHLWERYAKAVEREARLRAGSAHGPLTSVFFGGGTPSLVPADLLVGMLSAVVEAFGLAPGAEVTVECNPGTLTSQKLEAYRRAGVTRLSLGAQSMVPHVLASLGRQHSPGVVREAVALLAEAGFGASYNIDLIYGAAAESPEDWRRSLDEVLSLEPVPPHLSTYALTVEPGTPLAASPERHPVDDDQADKYLVADQVLSAVGYRWYELSNWAVPGHECRHNQLYWDQGEYVGLGCAAHSHQRLAAGGSRRWWNVRTPERYCRLVEAGALPEAASEDLTAAQVQWEALVLAMRTRRGAPAPSVPPELLDEGLVELTTGADGGRGVLTARGRLLANEVTLRLQAPGGGLG